MPYAARMTKPKDPFAALEKLRAVLPPGPAPAAPAPAPEKPQTVARAIVRMERKGRGGKEVTVVELRGVPAKDLERWCRELKQALGCGGAIDADRIVLQGDLRARIGAVLEARGVARVTIG